MKTAIITGASSGLGLECARALLRSDPSWHIVLAVRDTGRGAEAVDGIANDPLELIKANVPRLRCAMLPEPCAAPSGSP